MTSTRVLSAGDEPALEAFLSRHADSSMFLRANARAAGLEDHGAPFQGTYVAAFEAGRITGVAAHCWNGNVLLQAPADLEKVVREAAARSGRGVAGLIGPWEQVVAARKALGLEGRPAPKEGNEELFVLSLDRLVIPQPLASGLVTCRRADVPDLDLLTDWRVGFSIEALGRSAGPALWTEAREETRLILERDAGWILLAAGAPVAFSAFNSRLPDMVQVGGVWTPPELRGRGYARAVVAGSLLDARVAGARRAVLFAEDGAAKRAYLALGFRVRGRYGLILFDNDSPGVRV